MLKAEAPAAVPPGSSSVKILFKVTADWLTLSTLQRRTN
jgi:hypothetical protein